MKKIRLFEDAPGYGKDNRGTILAVDQARLMEYKEKRLMIQRMETLRLEINNLNKTVDELKERISLLENKK